jgi:hypothetical protein
MSRTAVLTDAQWERIEPVMPSSDGSRGRPFRDHRLIVEGIIYLSGREFPGAVLWGTSMPTRRLRFEDLE